MKMEIGGRVLEARFVPWNIFNMLAAVCGGLEEDSIDCLIGLLGNDGEEIGVYLLAQNNPNTIKGFVLYALDIVGAKEQFEQLLRQTAGGTYMQ